MIITDKHINQETGLIIENYPYGFRLRTKIKYWIETDKRKGDRFISQTLNPKTNLWNKPKYSIYNAVMVMVKDDKGYISYIGLYPTTSKEDILNFMNTIKDYPLNEYQQDKIRVLKAYSKAYENVTFKIDDVTNRTEEESIKEEEKQEKIKEDIRKLTIYHYNKQDWN